MATHGEIPLPELIEDVANESVEIDKSGKMSPPDISPPEDESHERGEISPPEISKEDLIQGVRAVNPDITAEELIRLVEDPETLEKIKSSSLLS